MTRDQARAILCNLDLIVHFANGGQVGHRSMTWDGQPLPISPTQKINICNLKPCRDKFYLKLKYRVSFDPVLKTHVKHEWHWPEKVPEHYVIPPVEMIPMPDEFKEPA